MMLLLSRFALAQAAYSETTAVSNLALAVSAYCGAPKYNSTFLTGWDCGPSCKGAPTVTDITTFHDFSLGIFGLVGRYNNHCLVDFRGTYDAAGWETDFKGATLAPFKVDSSCSGCEAGAGFYDGYMSVRPTLLSSLSSKGCKEISLTGHSLGGVLAHIAAMDLHTQGYTLKDLYDYGSPRAGNKAFATEFNKRFSGANHWRVTHSKDPVPHAPFPQDGFYHISQEAFYKNTTAAGVKICQGGEDTACADQFANLYANTFAALINAPINAGDHGQYMWDKISYLTSGGSCTHIAVTAAVQHAYLSTAAYCQPQDLQKWDCGTPCDRVQGGVKGVQVLDVPFTSRRSKGAVRGFVGKVEDRCVLSLRDPFDNDEGLELLRKATDADLENFPVKNFKDIKVYKVLLDAWRALEGHLHEALHKAGCSKDAATTSGRRLIVTGHGLGASLASLAAFQLKDGEGYQKGTFGIEGSFQFGSARIGNEAFAKAFQFKFQDDIFRVTHHQDPYVQYPKYTGSGFMHCANEIHFKGDAAYDQSGSTSYTRCADNGEDPKCRGDDGPVTDHTKYMQPLVEVDMSATSCKGSTAVMV